MPLTKEDLSAIQEALAPRFDAVDRRLNKMQRDIVGIREDLAEVRSATNALVAWADDVAVITQVRFPVKKAIGE